VEVHGVYLQLAETGKANQYFVAFVREDDQSIYKDETTPFTKPLRPLYAAFKATVTPALGRMINKLERPKAGDFDKPSAELQKALAFRDTLRRLLD
jgi:hypothetical protein